MNHAPEAAKELEEFIHEPLVSSRFNHLEWPDDDQSAHTARFSTSSVDGCLRRRWSRKVGRGVVAGSGPTGPARGRLNLFARAALIASTASLLVGCASADAVTTTKATAKKATSRKVAKKPVTTKKKVTTKATAKPTTTVRVTTTLPKLSAEAQTVLAGYEAYLVAYVAGSREPEKADELYAKGMTGDALARLIEIARFDVSNGQYWDGTRADISGNPRVQTIGDVRSTLRDCRSVGGVLRKRVSNEPVAGTIEADIDDLLVDLVKIDGRWVVTRTDRTNAVEGRAKCTAGSSP
jgi:hypothetical protein